MATTYTPQVEQFRAGGFLVSQANGHRSVEQVSLTGSGVIKPGTVLGKKTTGTTAVAAAVAGNTGNGTMGAVTVSAGAKPGVYTLTIIEPGTNVGAFMVSGPDGAVIGNGDVAAAFSAGGLAFTLADGATDFTAGDQFTITVAAGNSKYAPLNLSDATGLAAAAAIAWDYTDATSADKMGTAVVRDAEINASELVWPSGISAPQIATALAQLAAAGVIAR